MDGLFAFKRWLQKHGRGWFARRLIYPHRSPWSLFSRRLLATAPGIVWEARLDWSMVGLVHK